MTLLHRFDFEDCNPIATPSETRFKLILHDVGDHVDVTLYEHAVGCLIYVCITRLDIQFVVSHVRKLVHSPGSKHWQDVKRIFCYLHVTIHLGLFYPKAGSLLPILYSLIGLAMMTHVCPLSIFASWL